MKLKSIFLFFFTTLLFSCSVKTSLSGDNEHTQSYEQNTIIGTYPDYIGSITVSKNKSYIGFSIGSQSTIILDSNFNQLVKFTYDELWGGGRPVFSNDGKYFAYAIFNKSDSVAVYNFDTKKTNRFQVDVSEMIIFNKSNKLLISKNGHFRLYDIDSGKLSQEIITTNEGKEYFTSCFVLDEDDKNLYVTSNKNEILLYSTANWKMEKSLGKFDGQISNMKLCEKQLVFNIGNEIYSLNTDSKKHMNMKLNKFNYISDIVCNKEDKNILVAGDADIIYKLNQNDLDSSILFSGLSNKACYGLSVLKKNYLLIGNYYELMLYRTNK